MRPDDYLRNAERKLPNEMHGQIDAGLGRAEATSANILDDAAAFFGQSGVGAERDGFESLTLRPIRFEQRYAAA